MDYIERLEKSLSELENNSGRLSEIPELIKGIKELTTLYKEAGDSINTSRSDLKDIEMQLNDRIADLQKALKLEQDSKDELMNTIRSALNANIKEQLESINSVTNVVNNKISVAESNLTLKATEIDTDVKKVELKATENENKLAGVIYDVAKVDEKISSFSEQTSKDLQELKLMIPVIKRTQIISIVAAILALATCILCRI